MGVQKSSSIDRRDERPASDAGAIVITIAIGCCGLALAVVLAVAYVGL